MSLAPLRVDHLRQEQGFTCGPVALLMAMRAFRPEIPLPDALAIWRESTLVASKATSAEGLALAAARRGFHARVLRERIGPPFAERIRGQGGEMPVLDAFFDDTLERARRAGVLIERRAPAAADVLTAVEGRTPCLMLTDAHRFDPEESHIPHWVLALRREGDQIVFHDPQLPAGPTLRPAKALDDLLGFQDDSALVVVAPTQRF